MGAMSDLMYEQAEDQFCDALAEVYAEQFCRGSDAIGGGGWRIAGETLQLLGRLLTKAGERAAEKYGDGLDGPVESTSPLTRRSRQHEGLDDQRCARHGCSEEHDHTGTGLCEKHHEEWQRADTGL
jgi:hypothetical protein